MSAAIGSIDRSNPAAAINQLRAFQEQIRAQIAPLDSALAQTLLEAAQEVIDVLGGNPTANFAATILIHGAPTNAQVRIQFTAAPGSTQFIVASTNLRDWEVIGMAFERSLGAFEFDDPAGRAFATRFYRVLAQ